MGFSAKQLHALRRNPSSRHIRTREANGRELTYLEGWYAISEANRIFGFDGWSRETVESRCVLARENRGTFLAIYAARVRITVNADGATIVREGHGTGEGRGTSPAEVHDIALKAAETDATKRALATFGKPFGLELYRSVKTSAVQTPLPAPPVATGGEVRLGFHPDDTTPIPRPSRYYGRRQNPLTAQFRADQYTRAETCARSPACAERGSSSRTDRQEPARTSRAQAASGQRTSAICCFAALSRLRHASRQTRTTCGLPNRGHWE